MIQALLWDVDGTLAETERDGHLPAFNDAFTALGLPWRWSEARYGELLRITGGRERLLADMATHPDAPAAPAEREALARELHRRKNAAYEQRLAEGAIRLRAGVPQLLHEAASRGLRQAIVTTTSRANVAALLRHTLGASATGLFEATVCGEDVAAKKPDPEAYQQVLQRLGLEPRATLALEDSPAGVAAARGAGVPVVVTRSAYFAEDAVEGALDGVVAVGPGLHTRHGWRPALPGGGRADRLVSLDDLLEWRAPRARA
jgi:HAD superfamily hydrolase (TIGR01509 family)